MSPTALPTARLSIGRTAVLAPLRRSTDGGPVRQATRVELLDDGLRLSVRFDCVDSRPWATLAEHDADLWTEEVVELFVAPGEGTPTRYVEIEVNPLGTLFDARVLNPRGDRTELEVDRGWDCAGLESAVERTAEGWSARLAMPWASLAPRGEAQRFWRLNLFRIDRPLDASTEHSAWSPTGVDPPDFHRPARFGVLERLG